MPDPALSLVPLDDRPCNRVFPQQLAPIAGWDVLMPPREVLGRFTEPGDCESIAQWLREQETHRLVISLDMLCFGGLIASRTLATDPGRALERLEVLRALRSSRPDLIIFAFSIIMRLGSTVASDADLDRHLLLRAYSQLLDRAERLGEGEARSELAAVEGKLDGGDLDEYLQVRRRNHAVNRAAVQLTAEGAIDFLVLAQEDAAPVGIHIPEQMALRGQVEEFRVADRVAISPGADEMGLDLMARHVVASSGNAVGIAVDYAAQAGAEVVPEFETQPLRRTVEGHVGIAGARLSSPLEASAILFVHTPIERQPDIAEAPPGGHAPALALQADSVVERLEAASAAGRLVGLADLAYCNGADPELVFALQRKKLFESVHAFAGWNTTANTVGTVVSQLCLLAASGDAPARPASSDLQRFLACRFTDDYGYQSVVRAKAMQRAREMGTNPYALGESSNDLEHFVRGELEPLAHDFYSQLLGGDAAHDPPAFRLSLPWDRLFEVEVEFSSSTAPKNL